jgi:AraC-like DNA-binding protein
VETSRRQSGGRSFREYFYHFDNIQIARNIAMPVDDHITTYVRRATAALKLHLEKYPLKHKSCYDLLDATPDINRRTLEKAFKAMYGYRIKEYQVRQRLQFSKKYLKDGMPLKKVATKCYYRSQSAYCTAFRRTFNSTPTGWLKSGRNKKATP